VAEELQTDREGETSLPGSRSDPESQQHQEDPYAHDGGSDDDLDDDDGNDTDESFEALEDRFHGLEEEVAILVADVHDLALYTKLNITGFMKILKVRPSNPYRDAKLIHAPFRNTTSATFWFVENACLHR
jgi:hypothetical protein